MSEDNNNDYDKPNNVRDILRNIDRIKIDSGKEIEALDELYEQTVQRAETDIEWYQDKKDRFRKLSRLIRILTFALLSIGTVIPLSGISANKLEYIGSYGNLGFIVLALAGLMYSCDRMFMLSKGWMRYLATEMSIKALILGYRYDWKMRRAKLTENLTWEGVEAALQECKTFILAVHEEVQKETETWADDFQVAIESMGQRLKAKEAKIEERIKEVEKEKATGNLELSVLSQQPLQKNIVVTIDKGLKQEIMPPSKTCGFIKIPPREYKVSVDTELGGKPYRDVKIISVKAGETAREKFEIH